MSRIASMAATLVAVGATVAPPAVRMPPLMLWNASASAPIGFYAIGEMPVPATGVLAVIDPPETVALFAAERGYLPLGVPMLKHIEALPGQEVCRLGSLITVNGRALGIALERDRKGRALPGWQGCRIIAADEIFVMNRQVQDSLDGRYFGPFPATSIVGRARPLWTDERGDGHFAWLAPPT
ncbi:MULTISPECIES: S26 family signal peptidase [unclassified Mesorhizobium]|uniref:S26 family signal peptidase n=1 Tax=unclassified Mesorhizobium TaxID=325217 RepID=UPI000FDB70D9|nr:MULTISPECIES: S26 family signal peptidase [unclassified Mesorhizobium]TGQ04106.1 S26 family signal peptidase [Mesorhizobium sp. M2E.F.Ca.ET.219.01.1.1]TGT63300.1 S26 family signal peptidase [Mesorhizobium sp. M2E.F.Ca.ET.166.01.1.1]TGV96924.1 S26 family signal peptidase [Mesorhizobium sp. M2E.F.Ca.ET.154.01.1.1]